MSTFERWAVALGIGSLIIAKVAVIIYLMRQSGPDRTGALILAGVLAFGLVSVIVGVVLWILLSPAI